MQFLDLMTIGCDNCFGPDESMCVEGDEPKCTRYHDWRRVLSGIW